MENNGFGKWEQQIVVHVAGADAYAARRLLNMDHIAALCKPGCETFVWKRWTTRRGNDEDVVVELSNILNSREVPIDWSVDWDASVY